MERIHEGYELILEKSVLNLKAIYTANKQDMAEESISRTVLLASWAIA